MMDREPEKVVCIRELERRKITFYEGEEYDSFPIREEKGFFYWVGINKAWLISLSEEEFKKHFEKKKVSAPA